jgi:hypothetical protein
VNTFNDFLNSSVRGQVALMRAAQSGDPQAQQILQQYQKTYADQQAQAQAAAAEAYARASRPGEFDPNYYSNLPTQGG